MRHFACLMLAALASACADPGAPSGAASAGIAASSARASASAPAPPQPPSVDETASLLFRVNGRDAKTLSLAEIRRAVPEETFTAYDPYYNREKTFRAVPLGPVVRLALGAEADPKAEYVLRAKDGYTVPMRGSRVFEAGAYIAFADTEFPSWEPIGPQRANPGPFYLVWRNKDQQSLETHPRPWQLASIEIARLETLFPHIAPEGEPAGSAAQRGFAIFKEQCVLCHAVNREGGRVGPDLNVPKSIVEYRPEAQIKAYIRDPLTFRYGNMPSHPHLKDADLDDLVAYFQAMKSRKRDPSAAAPPKPTGEK